MKQFPFAARCVFLICVLNLFIYFSYAASIARKIYLKKGTGVGALQCVYGGAYRKGVRTEHFRRAAGGHIRHILQNLEKIGVVETLKKGYVGMLYFFVSILVFFV